MKKFYLTAWVVTAGLVPAWAWNDALFERMPDNAVLADVDGTVLLKRDVLTEEALWKSLAGTHNRSHSAQLVSRPQIASRFERETMLYQQALRERVLIPETKISKAILDIAHASGDKKAKYASVFCHRLGDKGDLLWRLVQRRIGADALERQVRESTPSPTDAEVAAERAKRAADNARATVLLAQSWASASNLWNRICASNDFDQCVAEYEEERDHIQGDPEWGCFTIDFFDDNARLQKRLRAAKPGDILPLMEANNGLMIIKVVGINHDAMAATSKDATQYRLASLFIAVPYFHPELTDEQLRVELLKQRQDAAWEAKVESCKARAKILYPSGREVFDTRTPFRWRKR